jgi:hypothetical protein
VLKDHCMECGMLVEGAEFHPHALCLLVKARGGDTVAARKDMAFVLRQARSDEPGVTRMINTFLRRERRARA